jgi:hypothetical protein
MPARLFAFALLAALAVAAVAAHAPVARAEDDWKETGTATRKKKFGLVSVAVYEIQHQMKTLPPKKSKEAAIDAETEKRFVLTMLRDVEPEKMKKALEDAFEANGCKDAEKIKTFLAAFKGELKEKSKVTIAYDAAKKETTVTVESGGGSAKLEGVEFMKAVWRIWFGKIDQEKLGDELLSKLS